MPVDNQSVILYLWLSKVTNWLSTVNKEFWLILNYSKVVWDIDTKFSPVVVLISFQLSTKFGAFSYPHNGFPAKTISNFKRAWRAHFLSHTSEAQEYFCFFGDVHIILLSFFYSSYCKKCWNLPPQVFRAPWLDSCYSFNSWLFSTKYSKNPLKIFIWM